MIEKLTKEEYDKLEGRLSRHKELWVTLDSLNVDEAVRIYKTEWNYKTDPLHLLIQRQYNKKHDTNKKFTSKTLNDGSGWVILRYF